MADSRQKPVTGNQKPRAVRLSPVLKTADRGPERVISFFPRRCVFLHQLDELGNRSMVHKPRESLPYVWTLCGRPASACLTIKQYKKRSAFKIGRVKSSGRVCPGVHDLVITAGAVRVSCRIREKSRINRSRKREKQEKNYLKMLKL